MSWRAHRATYMCEQDGKTARGGRWLAFGQRAPVCPKCRRPMALKDQHGLSERAQTDLQIAREAQSLALQSKGPSNG